MPGRTIFDHHDVTEEDMLAASYGEDYHYLADVAESDARSADRFASSNAAQERRLLNDLTAEEYAAVRKIKWVDADGLKAAIDDIRNNR